MMDRCASARWPVVVAMALIAAAVMLFQIALMRIFSFTIWHHFAFMVISVALLGFGASGALIQIRPGLGDEPRENAARCALGFSLSSILVVFLLARIPFDPTQVGADGYQLLYLALYYLLLLVPFAAAGLALVILLRGFAASVGCLYAGDLVGAGLGCVLTVFGLHWVGADGVVWAAALAAALAAWVLYLGAPSPVALRWLVPTAALLASAPLASQVLSIVPRPGKALYDFLDPQRFPSARHAHREWNAISRIDVVEDSGTVRWTANPHVDAPLPAQTQIIIDGDAATPIIAASTGPVDRVFLDYMLSSAAMQAFRPDRVLVVGAGGGVDVLNALHHGARSVDAVEVNPAIAALVTGPYAQWSGQLFADERVHLHVDEGRSFVRRTPATYDLIQLSLVDTWAGSAAGAYSLSESYLYTVEAFADYLMRLNPDGVVTLTRWLWSPPRETLKLGTVALAALESLGVERPRDHIVVLFLGRLGCIVVKRTPFTAADLLALERVATARQFGFLYFPGATGENEFIGLMEAADRDAWIDAYTYDLHPATDDQPFFFQFGRWRDAMPTGSGWREGMLSLSGRLVLVTTLIQALVLSLLLLLAPLVWGGHGGRVGRRRGVVVYFSAIGMSFMLLEISLMQRFTLFLGHPVYAVACVLAVLLIAAGLGSGFAAPRLQGRRQVRWVFIGIALLSVAYSLLLPSVFHAALGQSLPLRVAITTALLVPLGFLLGIPFPVALASLARQGAASATGWAWAANSCASVVGPLLAVLIAMDLGFSAVGYIAALGYLCAAAAFGRWDAMSPGRTPPLGGSEAA